MISREKPCQRRHHRLSAPLYVSIDGGKEQLADNWSLGGLHLDGVSGVLPVLGQDLSLTLILPFQGYDISFATQAAVVRVIIESRGLFLEFTDLSERSFDLMNHFVEDLIRGKMGTIDDTICRIDIPVTPISTSPTPNPGENIPIKRLPVKSILMSLFYIILGLFVFSYLAVIFYSKFFILEVSSSVISSKIQMINMPADGLIQPVNFSLGRKIRAKDEIFRIENNQLLIKIENKKSDIKRIQGKLQEEKEKYRIEGERMKLYQIVSDTDKKIIQAQLAGKKEELKSADENLIRMNKLYRNDVISLKAFDDARQKQLKIVYQVQELSAKLAQVGAMQVASLRRHYNHKEFTADLDMKAVELQSVYRELEIAQQQLDYLNKMQFKQVVLAPYDGKIVTIYQQAYSTVARNEPILLFEERGNIKATAYLNQQEILQIGLNDSATVFIPALNLNITAVVIKIDRNSLLINKKEMRYEWHDEKERTAMVTLKLNLEAGGDENIRAGLPVVVIFNRHSISSIFSKLFSGADEELRGAYDSI